MSLDVQEAAESRPMNRREAEKLTERIRLALDRFSTAYGDLADRISEAYERRAWEAMGYVTWEAYAHAELRPSSQIAAEVRREIVSLLSARGMAVRAIAPAIGVSKSQADRDRQVSHSGTPEPARDAVVSDWPGPRSHETIFAPTQVEVDGVVVAETRRVDLHADEPVDEAEEQLLPVAQGPAESPRVTGLDGKSYPSRRQRGWVESKRRPLIDQFRDDLCDTEARIDKLAKLVADDRFATNQQAIAARLLPALRRAASTLAGVLAALENTEL